MYFVRSEALGHLLLGIALVLAVGQGRPAAAQDPELPDDTHPSRLVAANVLLTGTFTTLRALAEGELDGWRDGLRTFALGGLGGYGFYQSKRLVGDGHGTLGVAAAYASASLVENAGRGDHPLGYVRFGPGPVDLRLRTPLGDSEHPAAVVSFNAVSIVSLVLMPALGFDLTWRNGTIYYETYEPLGREGSLRRGGVTFNRTVALGPSTTPAATAHETIHLVQALQVGAITPFYTLARWQGRTHRPFEFGPLRLGWNVQFDWLYAALASSSLLLDYADRPAEIEAYTLQPDPATTRVD